MQVALCSTEAVPFAKTGGMADVVGALPRALKTQGVECMVIMPFYSSLLEKGYDFKLVKGGLNVPMNDYQEEFYDLLECNHQGIRFLFIKNDNFFNRNHIYGTPRGDYRDNPIRFGFFCKAILAALEELNLAPDIIHLNDYHCALVSLYLHQIRSLNLPGKEFFDQTATVFTIHNLAYQGIYGRQVLDMIGVGQQYFSMDRLEFYGSVNFMKGGIIFSDKITTVSPTYSREILTPRYGEKLEGILKSRKKDLTGIVNGIDYSLWDPENDNSLCTNYGRDDLKGKDQCKKHLLNNYFNHGSSRAPLVGVVSRLSAQKGMDLIGQSLDKIIGMGFFMVVLGTGDHSYQKLLQDYQAKYKGNLSVNITYSDNLARLIYSGCDMFLMPSKYEPCGLGQLISLRYGTVPVVRDTGGLSDTIKAVGNQQDVADGGTGFKFGEYSSSHMLKALKTALSFYGNKSLWKKIMANGMKCDFSWKASALSYKKLYISIKK
ncbi:MAG: glycogen synthase GlgA [Actinomycetia bacterium]|nr:glycogen synthase GlgA [Actinomycetes bacterium]